MSPLISEGDQLFADESGQARTEVHDGDIIVFRRPENTILVKRVSPCPEGKDRKVFRNGKQLDEPYLAPPISAEPVPTSFAARTVPPGDLFVLGDSA